MDCFCCLPNNPVDDSELIDDYDYELTESEQKYYEGTYSKVTTYSELIDSNLQFFEGKLQQTFYYSAQWGKSPDQNNHAELATGNLISLHKKYRVYTFNGQSNYEDPEHDYIQRSYLGFLIEKEQLDKVHKKLINDFRIWTICTNPDYSIYGKDEKFFMLDLTLDGGEACTIWNFQTCSRPLDDMSEFDNVNKIVKKLITCWIICKDYCSPYTADQILLEHFEKHN